MLTGSQDALFLQDAILDQFPIPSSRVFDQTFPPLGGYNMGWGELVPCSVPQYATRRLSNLGDDGPARRSTFAIAVVENILGVWWHNGTMGSRYEVFYVLVIVEVPRDDNFYRQAYRTSDTSRRTSSVSRV